MTKHDMAKIIANKVDNITLTKIEEIVDVFFESLTDILLKGESYNQKNFGTFKRQERAERKGRNPQTLEAIIIPPTKSLKLIVSAKLKEMLKNS